MTQNPHDTDDDMDDINFDVGGDGLPLDSLNLPDDETLIAMERRTRESVVIYKNKRYAAGLIWLTDSTTDDPLIDRNRAKALAADFYCSRNFIQQTGYGFLNSGHRWGMPSITAMAADALVGEWHGVFRVGDRWLYVAVHADYIAPDGDLLFLTEAEAYNHFVTESTKFKWPKFYAPAHWNIKQSDGEIDIEQIIDGVEPVTLKPANGDAFFSGKANKNIVVLCGLILLTLFMFYVVAGPLFKSLIPARIADPVQNIEINTLVKLPPEEIAPVADPIIDLVERTSIPSPVRYLKGCMENFDKLMISIPGWDITTMRCRSNIAEAAWKRTAGSLDSIQQYIDQLPLQISKTYAANGTLLAATTINSYNDIAKPLDLSERRNAILLLNKRFGGIGNLQISDIAAEAPKTTYATLKATPTTALQSLQELPSLRMVLQASVSPMEIKDHFNVPGLTFRGVEWNVARNQWTYDTQIYLYPQNYKIPN